MKSKQKGARRSDGSGQEQARKPRQVVAAPAAAPAPAEAAAVPPAASVVTAPSMPPAQANAELALQFGLGMVVNTAQHMRASNVPPALMVQALLMGAGLVMQFYRLDGFDLEGAIQAGRDHQLRFEAQSSPPAGSA